MADVDGLDLVIRPGRIRIEDAGWNFLGFITRMLQGDGFRCLDREKLRLASRPGRRGDGVGGDFAIERTDRHECIKSRVARQLLDLVRAKLRFRDLVRLHAGGAQNDPQQRGVRWRQTNHADPVPCKIGDLLDFRRRLSFGALVRKSGRRPQHNEVLTHDGDGLRVGRHLQIATTDRKIGLASTKQGKGFDRTVGRDKRQPDCPAFAGEGPGRRLNHFVIVASRRSDGNPESYRLQHIIQCARCGAKNKKSNRQDQQ